eukprot:scaffold18918_cov66-Skeletonema_marinoi.AAC.1
MSPRDSMHLQDLMTRWLCWLTPFSKRQMRWIFEFEASGGHFTLYQKPSLCLLGLTGRLDTTLLPLFEITSK